MNKALAIILMLFSISMHSNADSIEQQIKIDALKRSFCSIKSPCEFSLKFKDDKYMAGIFRASISEFGEIGFKPSSGRTHIYDKNGNFIKTIGGE